MLTLTLSLLAGCFSGTDYAEGYVEAQCERILECYSEESLAVLSYDDVDGCVEYKAAEIEAEEARTSAEDCAFDRKAAQSCVDGLYTISCDEFNANEFPPECYEVCQEG